MIGNYILSGRFQAIASTTFSALISLLAPPFAYFISGSVVGLITLRKGAATGLQILVISTLLLLVFSLIAGLTPELSLVYALVVWLPVWAAATVLRLTERQGHMLLIIFILAVTLVVAIYVFIGDVSSWWRQWLDVMLEKAVPAEDVGQLKDAFEPAIKMLNAMMVAGLMLNIFFGVLCARWWQSRLFNLGAFQKEFYALQLPVMVLPVSALVFVLVFTLPEPWQSMFRDITIIMMFVYLIQGISAVHRNVAKLKLSVAWLVSMYCMLILLPQMGLFIACLGMTDIYVSWRRKKMASQNES